MEFAPTGFVSSAARGCSGKPKPASNLPSWAVTKTGSGNESGKPTLVVFGTVTVKNPAVLWYGRETMEPRRVCK